MQNLCDISDDNDRVISVGRGLNVTEKYMTLVKVIVELKTRIWMFPEHIYLLSLQVDVFTWQTTEPRSSEHIVWIDYKCVGMKYCYKSAIINCILILQFIYFSEEYPILLPALTLI
jgi:hypothetical protein